MRIGIIGVGQIGKTLALKLAEAGHDVVVANSTAPENIDKEVLVTGAIAVTAQEAVKDKDAILLSIPLDRITDLAPLFASVSKDVTVIDTSNYVPARDRKIEEIAGGQVESLWVQEQLGHPIAKAWNAVLASTFAIKGKPAESPNRIAIPISANRDHDREVTLKLVDQTGFDAYDAGRLEDSWRHQPGAPAYCTDLTIKEIGQLIDTAEKDRIPVRRDLAIAVIQERMGKIGTAVPDWDFILRLNRILYI